MGHLSCLACREGHTRPIYGKDVSVEFDPAVQMPGTPTIAGTRFSAEFAAHLVMMNGVKGTQKMYPHLTREELMVACWWAGLYGPRKYRKAWNEWAKAAGWHLWYRCVRIPEPPVEAVS